eukprot:g725.t1
MRHPRASRVSALFFLWGLLVSSSPYSSNKTERWKIRGNQISVAHHPSLFRSWGELSAYVDDLVAFGANFVEIAHIPDDEKLVETVVNISTILSERDVNVSLWWSADLARRRARDLPHLFSKSPRIDSLFFPGGDGGSLEWSVIETTASALRTYHPRAGIWVSAQEANETALRAFYRDLLRNDTVRSVIGPEGGAVYGPHNRVSLDDFVADLADGSVSVRQYPDLAHAVDAQFQIKEWDAPWAFSYGRQIVNPLPSFHASVVRSRSPSESGTFTVGAGVYSEGLNDDLNSFIWIGMGANRSATVEDIVGAYCERFFGSAAAKSMADGLFGLERNWRGLVETRTETIRATLGALERGTSDLDVLNNWRAMMYLRRGYMDAYIHDTRVEDLNLVADVETILRNATSSVGNRETCLAGVADALAVLRRRDGGIPATRNTTFRARIVELTREMNRTIGAEVLQTQDTSLNMATLDSTRYLVSSFLESLLSNVSASSCQNDVVNKWLEWENPGIGGFYDNFGSVQSSDHPHLTNPHLAASDPSCYGGCAIQGGSEALPNVRPTWLRYAMVMYDNAMRIRYDGLNVSATYEWDVVMWYCASDCEDDVVTLTCNSLAMAVNISAPNPMRRLTFRVPPKAVVEGGGSVEIACVRTRGLGGNGKACQLSEAWLRRV